MSLCVWFVHAQPHVTQSCGPKMGAPLQAKADERPGIPRTVCGDPPLTLRHQCQATTSPWLGYGRCWPTRGWRLRSCGAAYRYEQRLATSARVACIAYAFKGIPTQGRVSATPHAIALTRPALFIWPYACCIGCACAVIGLPPVHAVAALLRWAALC